MIIVPQSTSSFQSINNIFRDTSTTFNGRVAVAITNAALDIAAESNSTPNYANRQALVPLVVQHPDQYVLAFITAIAVEQNFTTLSGVTDAELYSGALAVWNAMAGVS